MGVLAFFTGCLLITLTISRILLWLTRSWDSGFRGLALVHAVSAGIAVILAAYGFSDGGPLAWSAGRPYLLAQCVWLVVDYVRFRRRSRSDWNEWA